MVNAGEDRIGYKVKNKKLANNSKAKRPDELILEVDCRNKSSSRDDDTIRSLNFLALI